MPIGEKIKALRLKKGLTQRDLAEKLNVSYTVISQYERGVRNPKLETVEKIADALNEPITKLIDDYTFNLLIDKKAEERFKTYEDVGSRFSESAKNALFLYEELNQTNQNKVIGYMERLLEEEEKNYKELLKRSTKIINGEIVRQGTIYITPDSGTGTGDKDNE